MIIKWNQIGPGSQSRYQIKNVLTFSPGLTTFMSQACGGSSSGRTSDCGSDCPGFESHWDLEFFLVLLSFLSTSKSRRGELAVLSSQDLVTRCASSLGIFDGGMAF